MIFHLKHNLLLFMKPLMVNPSMTGEKI